MKLKLIGALFAAVASSASASITIQTQFGTAFTSGNSPVADGTPWALVVDADANDTFAGGFNTSTSLQSAGANSVFSIGQTLSLGSLLGADRIFAMGTFNGAAPGLTDGPVIFNLASEGGFAGVISNAKYAFYFFPNALLAGNAITVGDQVGGVSTAISEAGLGALVIPSDGANVPQGVATADGGGTFADANFTAVNLTQIPEPTTALLGALGILAMLRRRRN